MRVSPSNTLPKLPQELFILIYDYLVAHGDWETLRACGVLCRSQVEHVRRRLFRSIALSIHSQNRTSAFVGHDLNPKSISDIARRVSGLAQTFKKNPVVRSYVHHLIILDTFPVYKSDWITSLPDLPLMLESLTSVRTFTFGCEVGNLGWRTLSLKLSEALALIWGRKSRKLKRLHLQNISGIPAKSLFLSLTAKALVVKNVTLEYDSPALPPRSYSPLQFIEIRTSSLAQTKSASMLIHKMYNKSLAHIIWKCWEDASSMDGATLLPVSALNPTLQILSGAVNAAPPVLHLTFFPMLKRLSFKISFGKVGRDLSGIVALLAGPAVLPPQAGASALNVPGEPPRLPLRKLELSIHFPCHSNPTHRSNNPDRRVASVTTDTNVLDHTGWEALGGAMTNQQVYPHLEEVVVRLFIKDRMKTNRPSGAESRIGVIPEFRRIMEEKMKALLAATTFKATLHVRVY